MIDAMDRKVLGQAITRLVSEQAWIVVKRELRDEAVRRLVAADPDNANLIRTLQAEIHAIDALEQRFKEVAAGTPQQAVRRV